MASGEHPGTVVRTMAMWTALAGGAAGGCAGLFIDTSGGRPFNWALAILCSVPMFAAAAILMGLAVIVEVLITPRPVPMWRAPGPPG